MSDLPDLFLPDAPKGDRIVVVSPGWKLERTVRDRRRFAKVLAPVVVTPPPPPVEPPPPTGDYVEMRPTDRLATVLADHPAPADGRTKIVCRGGTYRGQGMGATRKAYRFELIPYAGEPSVFDFTGESEQHLLYQGDGSDVILGGVGMSFIGWKPHDSGVISPGDGSMLTILPGTKAVGVGPRISTTHFVYLAGADNGKGATVNIHEPDFTKSAGTAIQAYRGQNHVLNVYGGKLGGLYDSVLNYDAIARFYGVEFVEPTATWDVDTQSSSGGVSMFLPHPTTGLPCRGTGPNGAVRQIVHT